jgi:hypothetical protein
MNLKEKLLVVNKLTTLTSMLLKQNFQFPQICKYVEFYAENAKDPMWTYGIL